MLYPSFTTPDAPTREFCSARRARTSIPLQSVLLMNDPVGTRNFLSRRSFLS